MKFNYGTQNSSRHARRQSLLSPHRVLSGRGCVCCCFTEIALVTVNCIIRRPRCARKSHATNQLKEHFVWTDGWQIHIEITFQFIAVMNARQPIINKYYLVVLLLALTRLNPSLVSHGMSERGYWTGWKSTAGALIEIFKIVYQSSINLCVHRHNSNGMLQSPGRQSDQTIDPNTTEN